MIAAAHSAIRSTPVSSPGGASPAAARWWAWLVGGRMKRRARLLDITYIGEGALRISGGVTGAAYRFDRKGATLPVDPRDAAALLVRDDLRMLAARVVPIG